MSDPSPPQPRALEDEGPYCANECERATLRAQLSAALAQVAELRRGLRVIASLEHHEECELVDSDLAPSLEGAICTCCESCRNLVDEARALLAAPPKGTP